MKMTTEELGAALEDSVNCFGDGGMGSLSDYMANRIHRTLNQAFTGSFVLDFVRKMSDNFKNENYDGRNKTACEMCDAMWEGLVGKFPYMRTYKTTSLPLI